jgi:hypothetical protein
MSDLTLNALLLLTAGALSVAATAQVSYKCGNSYSQTPCPGGVMVDTQDKRTGAQKIQADLATQRDARMASAMEKARLQQEARDLAANTPELKASSAAAARKESADQIKKKKKKTTKVLVIRAPAEKKKARKPNTVPEKTDTGKS